MSRWPHRFNSYLVRLTGLAALAVGAALLAGCETTRSAKPPKPGKEATTIHLHLETNLDGTQRTVRAPIFREKPVMVGVATSPFLDESNMTNAVVVETFGGFTIRLDFDARGGKILEAVTTGNRGKRIAVAASFGENRWLAAPMILRPTTGGSFSFTPDATREEADRIVRGLVNVIREQRKRSKTWGLSE